MKVSVQRCFMTMRCLIESSRSMDGVKGVLGSLNQILNHVSQLCPEIADLPRSSYSYGLSLLTLS